MEKGLGQSIIIDNKGGGGGNVAMLEVARADPDGYTLIIGHVGSQQARWSKVVRAANVKAD